MTSVGGSILVHPIPQRDTGSHRYIQGMLHPQLGYLNTSIAGFHHIGIYRRSLHCQIQQRADRSGCHQTDVKTGYFPPALSPRCGTPVAERLHRLQGIAKILPGNRVVAPRAVL